MIAWLAQVSYSLVHILHNDHSQEWEQGVILGSGFEKGGGGNFGEMDLR